MKKKIDYDSFARATKKQVEQKFATPKTGLTAEQVKAARQQYGSNQLTYQKKTPFIVEAIKAYITPFTLVLIALAVISFFTDYVHAAPADKSLFGVIIIIVMVFISGTMSLIQSVRSNQAATQMESLVQVKITVKRDGKDCEVDMDDLVCGDLIQL